MHVADFAAHVARLHADSDIGFSREYNEILRWVCSRIGRCTFVRGFIWVGQEREETLGLSPLLLGRVIRVPHFLLMIES